MEGPLQILKEESIKVKELIGNIKIKPTKNQDKNPLPIHIHINISQPDDALAYDINEIKLEIIITQLEPAQLLVKVDPQLNDENNIIAPDEEELEFDEDEAAEYWRKKREEEYEALLVQQKKEAEEKRLEYERDPSLHYKVPILSRKEQEALKAERDKQGVRLRKTGPR
ncbi:hypothetical protein HDV02_004036 [Globomyces sp. JEL0801]|nr:hypothetical protein HDV02_004036 [Globomyces sp. JEL0801]